MTSGFSPEETLIGDLYQAALKSSPSIFQSTALKLIGRFIGFDQAWWGILAPAPQGYRLRSSYRHELPTEFEEHWKLVSSDDTLASNVHVKPRTTIHYSPQDLSSTPGLKALNGEQNIRHALCTSVLLPDQQSFFFITLFRSGRSAQTFTVKDITTKQQMTSHLYLSWKANLQAEIERMRFPNLMLNASTAFLDAEGSILCADKSFEKLLKELCPSWTNMEKIPSTMLGEHFISPNDALKLSRVSVGGLLRLDIRRQSMFHKLTPREKQIAQQYADGKSYKQIAAELTISPVTVRHYLQAIYAKVGINDKAELVRLTDEYSNALQLTTLTSGATSDLDMTVLRM